MISPAGFFSPPFRYDGRYRLAARIAIANASPAVIPEKTLPRKRRIRIMLMISSDPIDPATVYDLIAKNHAGSVLFHYAVVKEQNSRSGVTSCIEYETVGDTSDELEEIAAELKLKWAIEDLILWRRIGCLKVGDIISLIAVSSPSSEDAFASCKHGIAKLKKMKSIRKSEKFSTP